jgi:hypothetical protein
MADNFGLKIALRVKENLKRPLPTLTDPLRF